MKVISAHGIFSVYFCNPPFHKQQLIAAFIIQGTLPSNKPMKQILKEALQNHEF